MGKTVEKAAVNSYRDLWVWPEAMTLAANCYELTRGFPKEEMFGMSSQIRRSSASVAANIAEGHGRELTRSFIQYLRMAQGSLKELETHLLLAERVRIAGAEKTRTILSDGDSLGKMLRAYIRALQRREAGA